MVESEIDSEHLISLVQSKPELWDKTNEIYKDRFATRLAWEELCSSLNQDYQTLDAEGKGAFLKEVMKRWTNMRDAFAKFCRKEREMRESGTRPAKKKKYIYHNQMKFMAKLYDAYVEEENGEENSRPARKKRKVFYKQDKPNLRKSLTAKNAEKNCEDNREDDSKIDNETFIDPEHLRTLCSVTLCDTGGDDNLTSVKTASNKSRLQDSFLNKRKSMDDSDLKTLNALDGEKSNRHLSFFRGIIPSLEEFNEQEVIKFQMGVLQLIGNIGDQRHKASLGQLTGQSLPFSPQPGPSAVPLSTATYHVPYPCGQPIFPAFWPAACHKCSHESTPRESTQSTKPSNPVDESTEPNNKDPMITP